ncbi:putative Ig domain-containing protein [Microvirga sp. STS02]|uniref:putative Ig domain-containing protein n=1 Tax=Hymenobacter negativus TaxID=2795026 RepID=UPI0018DDF9F3|nr:MULTISPECIES: putative Ig domain-containing protein [Bacteria]MBH8567410.1 putative Ig domain-containing protein [Hymenobacter negativus]MBR7207142.1 putative Ig domain-containing protein [Microvirga sp. STS02]
MRQKLLLLLLLLLAAWGARAQAPTWQSALSSAAVDVRDVAITASGDVYVTGSFTGSVQFGTNPTLTSTGDQDMFVAKWASGAANWAWSASAGGGTAGSSGDANDYGNAIAVNGTRVYVAGVTRSTSFVSGSGSLTNGGLNDMFLARFTDNGGTVAASGLFGSSGGASSEYAYGLAVNAANGNVYVTGYFGSTGSPNVTISGSALASAGSADVYVAKYFDNGTTMSTGGATRAGGTSAEVATGIALNGNTIYISARFGSTGTAVFGSSTLTSAGANDLLVARLTDTTPTANGGITVQNALRGGGTESDAAEGIAVNTTTGSIYVTGYVTGNAGGAFVAGSTLSTSGASQDIFVAKYTDNGSALVNGYAIVDGGANTENGAEGLIGADIAVNGSLVYVTSDYDVSTTIAGTPLTSAGGSDAFVAKYTDNGSTFVGNGAVSGGGAGADGSFGIAVNGTQGVVGGRMVPTANFGTALTSGSAYAARVNFAAAPTVTTAAATGITINSAVLGGNVTADGGDAVTARGVVYSSTATTPAIGGGGVTQAANGTGTGAFSATISSLTPGTTYYVRAYATNSVGTSYGAVVSFTTSAIVVAPATLPAGTAGAAYSQTITASGGTAPYTYAITAGALPAGLTLSSAGVLSGTPTAAGTFNFTVRATDASASPGPYSGTQAYTLTIAAPTIAVSPAALPNGTVGTAYSQTITASGGTAPYTYAITAGALPAGLTLTSAGVLSGTPTASGSFNFTVRATDATTGTGSPFSGSRSYTFTISAPTITVAPTTLPDGATNTAYSQTITASGGTAPYSYAITTGALPAGLTLTGAGVLAGTPTAAGTFNFTVTATDASTGGGPYTGSRSYTLTIVNSTVTVSSVTRLTPSPTATAQVLYRVVFSGNVTGLTTGNFFPTITSGSISGASVLSVSGSGTTYTVTVNTGTGDGMLRLDVVNSTGTSPTISNVSYTGGEVYEIKKSFLPAPQLTIVGTGGTGSDVTAFVDLVRVLQSGTSTVASGALQNGSFEQHDPLANGNYGYQPTGASWLFNARAGIAEDGSAFTPITPIPNGVAVAFVQSTGAGNGQLQQNLAVPTGSYQVNFQAAQRLCCTTLDQALNVFINGVFVGNILPGTNGYTTFTSAAFNVTAPALTATVSTTSTSPTSTSPIPFSVSFSQSVGSTFTASDVTVTGGTLTSGSFSGSGAGPYTFTVTPSGTGTVTVSLAAGVATDANNTANAASNAVSVQSNQPQTAAPVVTAPANNSFSNIRSVTATGTAPAGSTVSVYIGSNLAGTTTASATGAFSFAIPGNAPDGTYTVSATAQSSGATVSASSNVNTFTIDGTAPTASLSSPVASGGTTTTTPVSFTATFNEPVTGLTAAGLTVTNGTVTSGPTAGSGNTYTFQVTPSTAGTVTVRVAANAAQDRATNGNAASALYSFTFQAPTITVAPAALPDGTRGTAYNQTITAAGGTAPYTYAITAGALPSGLTLSSAGVLSGTPAASGTFNFTVTATDASAAPGPYSGSRSYTLTVAAPTIAVSPTTLPNGTQGTAYSQALSASGGTAPYTYAVTAGSLPSGLTLSSAGVLAGTPAANGTFSFTVTATDAFGSTGSQAYSLVVAAPSSVTWTGLISTDWFTAGNWTFNTLPSATIDAIIPTSPSGGRFPNISAGVASARNLTFDSGASLTMSAGTVVIAANLTNNGTFQPTGGTVLLGNSVLSNIFGASNTRFWNLTVGPNGVQQSTSASMSVQRVFLLNGNYTTNGNPLTLESNATNTALVVNNGSAAIVGNATVQRYIAPDLNPGLGYRHYSAPVSTATVGSLTTASFTPVVNPAYNTSATPNSVRPFPTVYYYDQARLATATNNLAPFDKGWTSPSALTDPLTVGKGYTVNLAANQTLAVTGQPNNGDVSQSLARNSGATAADAGWQLLGNPYPSPLDYSQVGAADRVGLDAALYVFESTSLYGGTYRANVNGVGGNANSPNSVLAQGQGFFVRVSAGQTSGTLTLRNSHRVTTYQNPVYHRTTETRPLVQLDLQSAAGSDPLYVYFEQAATAGMDAEYDAVKLPNSTGLNLAAWAGSDKMAINALPLTSTAAVTVPLFIGLPVTGTYTLHAAQVLNFGAGEQPFLRDLQLGTLTDLSLHPDYTFTMNAANTTTRFELVFGARALGVASAKLAAQVAVYPNPASKAVFVELPTALNRKAVTAALVDALGRVVLTQALPAGQPTYTLPLTNLATGVYSLRLQTEAGVVVKKLVVE